MIGSSLSSSRRIEWRKFSFMIFWGKPSRYIVSKLLLALSPSRVTGHINRDIFLGHHRRHCSNPSSQPLCSYSCSISVFMLLQDIMTSTRVGLDTEQNFDAFNWRLQLERPPLLSRLPFSLSHHTESAAVP